MRQMRFLFLGGNFRPLGRRGSTRNPAARRLPSLITWKVSRFMVQFEGDGRENNFTQRQKGNDQLRTSLDLQRPDKRCAHEKSGRRILCLFPKRKISGEGLLQSKI